MAGRTVVVGAGLAGLSAAIHLAAAGREVVVVEAEAVPGGRCGTVTVGGYRFDTGPSVLTMSEVVRSTVGAAGEELEDWLELAPLDPIYRLTFHDGSSLDGVPGGARRGGAGAGRAGRRGWAAPGRRRPPTAWPSGSTWGRWRRLSGGRSSTATTTVRPTCCSPWPCCG